jgi:hypothetical protein
MERKAYRERFGEGERMLAVSYLALMTKDAPQGDYPSHEVFNALRRVTGTRAQWRLGRSEVSVGYRGFAARLAIMSDYLKG